MKVRGDDPDLELGLSGQNDTVRHFSLRDQVKISKNLIGLVKKNEIFMRSEFSKHLLGHCLKLYLNPELCFGS